jgi:dCMP deaminase
MTSPVFEKGYPDYDAVNRQEPHEEYIRLKDREITYKMKKWDIRFMEMAKLIASWSKDPTSQIGAVAVNDEHRILATGYNGFPKGIDDTQERLNDRPEKYRLVIHAEMNALMNALYSGVSLNGATMYVHGLPVCSDCAKCVIQAGIKRVVIPTFKSEKGDWQKIWEERSAPMFKEANVQVTILG